MNSNKILNLDINELSISENGVANFYWPIETFEVHRVCLRVLNGLSTTINEAIKKDLAGVDLAIILNLHFAQISMMCYQALLLISRAKRDGYELKPDKRNRLIDSFLQGSDVPICGVLDRLRKGPAALKRWRAPLRYLRDILVGVKEGMTRRSLFPVNYQKHIISVTTNPFAGFQAKQMSEKVFYRRYNTWFSSLDEKDITFDPLYLDIINRMLTVVTKEFVDDIPDYMQLLRSYLYNWLVEGFSLVDAYLRQIAQVSERIPVRLWGNVGGDIWGRILARSVKRENGEVMRFSHGSGAGYFASSRAQGGFYFEDCDVYSVFSNEQIKSLQEAFTGDEIVQTQCPKIICANKKFKSIHVPYKKNNKGQKVVMYVSSVYPGEFFYVSGKVIMNDLVVLDWQVRLFSQLEKMGYKVLLKPHPVETISCKSPLTTDERFESILSEEPFEKVRHMAEVIIFDEPTTTVFSSLCLSDQPFIYIDFGLEDFSEKARVLLQKRSPIVQGWFDDENRAVVNWDNLREAIESCHHYKDDGFANTYFEM